MKALAAHVHYRLAAPVYDTGWYLVAMLELAWLPTALCKGLPIELPLAWGWLPLPMRGGPLHAGLGNAGRISCPPMCNKPLNSHFSRVCIAEG